MDRLDELEAESVYILREAYCKLGKLRILWSIGKDPTVVAKELGIKLIVHTNSIQNGFPERSSHQSSPAVIVDGA